MTLNFKKTKTVKIRSGGQSYTFRIMRGASLFHEFSWELRRDSDNKSITSGGYHNADRALDDARQAARKDAKRLPQAQCSSPPSQPLR
jgi:hypothetical protein